MKPFDLARVLRGAGLSAVILSTGLSLTPLAFGEDPAAETNREALTKAVQKTAGEKRLLRYKFEKGQRIRWEVTHLTTTNLRDKDFVEHTQSKTTSIKLWTVKDVAADGSATIVNSVESMDLWHQKDGEKAETYNSRTDTNPPLAFSAMAKTIGIPLSEKVLDTRGQVLKNEGNFKYDLGMGPVVPPLPEEPIAVGHRWVVPGEFPLALPSKQVKQIKVQYVHVLEMIDGDEARIAVKTEVLTPLDDPREEGKLVQKIFNGTVVVDLAKGQVSERQFDWNRNVIGFNGQQGTGTMDYLARLTETLIDGPSEPIEPAPAAPAAPETASAPIVGPALK